MVRQIIKEAIKKAGGENFRIEFPLDSHGDFSTNMALIAAKKEGKNPREIAEEVLLKLKKDKSLSQIVEKIEIAGPGFINFWLSKGFLLENLKKISREKEKYGKNSLGKGKTMVIDYSSPNIAKRFSVGHLRSTIIGQAIYNLYQFLGFKVIGDNHLGDWGTQFGTILYQISSKKLDPDKLTIDKLEELYVDFNKEVEEDPSLKEKAREWFKKLEEGDSTAKETWQKIIEISMKEFNRVYELLGVKIDEAYGESTYEELMQKVIEELKKKKILKESEGAQVVEFDDLPSVIVVKSNGGTTYLTRDLATIKFRLEKWDPSIIVYEVGAEQTLHFRQLFKIAEKLGWTKGRELVHVSHGLFLVDGKKMSTRKGTAVKLEEVLEEGIKKAQKIIEKSKTGGSLSAKEIKSLSRKVGIGAIKYLDLSHHPTSNIEFDWETIFALEGSSAPYIQYTFARTQSVLAKVGESKKEELGFGQEETNLMRSLSRFPELIVDAAKNYSPNILTTYLFSLAQDYNSFYNKERIIGSKNEALRILLTAGVGQVLANGLTLLGIEAPSKM